MTVLLQSPIENSTFRGKVRETYRPRRRPAPHGRYRPHFGVRLHPAERHPGQGAVLTQMSKFWFEMTRDVVPNHYIRLVDGLGDDDVPFALPPELRGRSMIVKKAGRLDVECIVRGYVDLAGAGWAEYKETGSICGLRLLAGLVDSQELSEPLFTPTTKAEGGHDLNMPYSDLVQMVGPEIANTVRLRSLALYTYAAGYARERGIIIADTKFEFGIVTASPSSSTRSDPGRAGIGRRTAYEPGHSQPRFDKQFVRDWLLQSGWDREPPPPTLPADVIEETAARYREAFTRLTGSDLQQF